MLDDAAQRHAGQVFALHNDDLLLLFSPDGGPEGSPGRGMDLPDTLARLFQVDVPDAAGLITMWSLARDAAALLHYAQARLQDTSPGPAPEPFGAMRAIETIDAIDAVVQNSRITDLMQRQTAVLLLAGGRSRLRLLFQEVAFSVALLEARIAAAGQTRFAQANADPFLFRHLASRLDGRMLDALREDLQVNGPLTAGARDLGPTLHLNLTVSGILSDRFAHFAAMCRAVGAQVGVEVSLVEACGDPDAFAIARTRLRLAGLSLVLDNVSHHALMLTTPMALEPDFVKLDWSPRLPQAGRAVEQAVQELGAGRIVLQRAETEQALTWGLSQGIRRFQGRHVDAMLAAGRIAACSNSGNCTLRQYIARASATGLGGLAGCHNPSLLDAASPLPALLPALA